MNHIDEHTLELFILHAESVEGQRSEIEAHLAECRGCKDLADEIASFHTELKDELAKPRSTVAYEGKALAK
jgi:predicted anti-sigma-YlaC factor YlaD